MADLVMCRSSEGLAVAEVDLDATEMSQSEVIAEAVRRGAALLWAYSDQPPKDPGFVPTPGYARLRAEAPTAGTPLPLLATQEYGALMSAAYRGLWGHKWVDAHEPLPNDDSIVILLAEEARPVGLCRTWPRARLADQPGVLPTHRGAAPALALLAAACSAMGPGPVEVETWGESADILRAYCEQLGFEVVERRPGWELPLQRIP